MSQVGSDASKHIGQPHLGVDAVHFCFDDAARRPPRSEPQNSQVAKSNASQPSLDGSVGEVSAPVLEEQVETTEVQPRGPRFSTRATNSFA